MLSDGRSIIASLEKEECRNCGLMRHISSPSQEEIEAIFSQDYALHARLTNSIFEDQRQRIYAEWILDLLRDRKVNSVFEIGAGTGSLMAELQRRAPSWRLKGVEPVPAAVSHRTADLDIERGLLRDIDTRSLKVDVVLSVNVIEHVHNPLEFLQQSKMALTDDGCIVVICPDGDRPTTEMLIYDHIHSFTSRAIEGIAKSADLAVIDRQTAPPALGAFQAILLARGFSKWVAPRMADDLFERRMRLFSCWQKLDDALYERIRDCPNLWAFGGGENAQLLRAYAPNTWNKVRGILADSAGFFDARPITRYEAASASRARTVLLAVRPEIQIAVAQRLINDGNSIIRWDDLVPSF